MPVLEQTAADESGLKWITLGEKDSPYYGMNSAKMTRAERRTHADYIAGKVKGLSSEDSYKICGQINSEMRIFRRELAKKFHKSEEEAKNIILNT